MRYLSVFLFLLVLFIVPFISAQNKTMQVEVNLIANQVPDMISIEVPDHIFLGDVTKGEATDKSQIYVNNTGNVGIKITPQLSNADEIFSNLYFQSRQSGNNSVEYKIGDYNFNITKPSAGGKKSEYFWMWLDLTDYDQDIEQTRMGLTGDVVFVALPN